MAHQAPLSLGFSRQEYWRGLPWPPLQGYLPDSENPRLFYLLDWQLGSLPLAPPGKPQHEVYTPFQFSSVQLFSRVQLFVTPWTAACQASLSITNSWILLKLMSIKSVMQSTISPSVIPFSSHLQSFPASGSFPMSQFFASDGQSIFTFSISPSNKYSGLISSRMGWMDLLAVQGLSRVFSNTTV